MAKKNNKLPRAGRTGWLKLILELIVVFVGVSAGFLFDNFREELSDKKLEEKYLGSIYENLVADSIEIRDMLQNSENNIDISGRTVSYMQEGTASRDSALAVLGLMATYNNLNLENATYESVVNSGNLGLIRDFDIREKIVYYYRSHEDMRYIETVYNDYVTNYIIPYVSKNLDFISGQFVDGFRVDDIEFRNITSGYYTLARQKMEFVRTLDSLNIELRNSLAPVVKTH